MPARGGPARMRLPQRKAQPRQPKSAVESWGKVRVFAPRYRGLNRADEGRLAGNSPAACNQPRCDIPDALRPPSDRPTLCDGELLGNGFPWGWGSPMDVPQQAKTRQAVS